MSDGADVGALGDILAARLLRFNAPDTASNSQNGAYLDKSCISDALHIACSKQLPVDRMARQSARLPVLQATTT